MIDVVSVVAHVHIRGGICPILGSPYDQEDWEEFRAAAH